MATAETIIRIGTKYIVDTINSVLLEPVWIQDKVFEGRRWLSGWMMRYQIGRGGVREILG
jgi:hypothetical protein